MAAKFFTGLPLDGPDPECVKGYGELALAGRSTTVALPLPSVDHSRTRRAVDQRRSAGPSLAPDRACDPSPLVGLACGAPDE